MRRLLGLAALVLLFAGVGCSLHHRLDPDPLPLAIDDPATGEAMLWPGSAEAEPATEPPAPAMLVTTCEIGPKNLPIVNPENDT